MTMEQVLRDIKHAQGPEALANGEVLVGLFKDFSKNQLRAQANALMVFVSCQGNTRILNLQNAPVPEQQVQFCRLVQELTGDHNMQETTAADVCATFWRVANGTEPPAPADNFVPEPMPPVSEPTPVAEPKPEPYFEVPSEHPVQQTKKQPHTPLEIAAFSIGWLLIGGIQIVFVAALLDHPNLESNPIHILYVIGMLPLGGMQYGLWMRKLLQWYDFTANNIFAFAGLVLSLLLSVVFLESNRFTLVDFLWELGALYCFLWSLIPILEERKNKRGGKK